MSHCKPCSCSTPCSCKNKGHNSAERSYNFKNMTPNRQVKPVERHLYIRITPEKKRSLHVLGQNNLCSPLQTISESCSQVESCDSSEYSSTPLKTSHRSINPFDIEIDSLHLTSLSPSVFATIHTKGTPEGKSFRWSIEQLAVLKPVDIDESSQQDVWIGLDAELNMKAQDKINAFFSQNQIVPSPWGPTTNHETFAPNLASTAYVPPGEELNLSTEEESCATTGSAKEACTQTMVTIPPGVDLMALLGQFCTYQDDACKNDSSDLSSDGGVFSTSSLRRKLFVNEEGDAASPSRVVDETAECQLSPKHFTTNEVNEWVTPGSDLFSSSPITPRNCSISTNCAGRSMMSSPTISPICLSSARSQRTGSGLRLSRRSIYSWKRFMSPEQCSPALRNGESKKIEGFLARNESPRIPASMNNIKKIMAYSDTEHINNNQEMVSQMESAEASDNPPFSITDSCSQQQDTGYQTSSLNSMASLSSISNVHFPATEMLDCCMTSRPNGITSEELAVSSMSLDQSGFYADDSALSEMAINHENHDQNSHISTCFNSLKWKQNVCSTPTKYAQFLEHS